MVGREKSNLGSLTMLLLARISGRPALLHLCWPSISYLYTNIMQQKDNPGDLHVLSPTIAY